MTNDGTALSYTNFGNPGGTGKPMIPVPLFDLKRRMALTAAASELQIGGTKKSVRILTRGVGRRHSTRGRGGTPGTLLGLAPAQIFPQRGLQPLLAAAGMAGFTGFVVVLGPVRHGLIIAGAAPQASSSIALLFGWRLWQFPPRSRRPPLAARYLKLP